MFFLNSVHTVAALPLNLGQCPLKPLNNNIHPQNGGGEVMEMELLVKL
jgi:hypothetical protein